MQQENKYMRGSMMLKNPGPMTWKYATLMQLSREESAIQVEQHQEYCRSNDTATHAPR